MFFASKNPGQKRYTVVLWFYPYATFRILFIKKCLRQNYRLKNSSSYLFGRKLCRNYLHLLDATFNGSWIRCIFLHFSILLYFIQILVQCNVLCPLTLLLFVTTLEYWRVNYQIKC